MADKELKLKVNILRRIKRDLEYYAQEYGLQSDRIAKMRAGQQDDADIRKQEEVLLETETMLPDCQARLKEAFINLEKAFQSFKSDSNEDDESVKASLQEATELLEAVPALLKSGKVRSLCTARIPMKSLYAAITPSFTQDLLAPDLKIGYTDEGGLWDIISPFLMMRLPLRMIEWKNIVGVKKIILRLHMHFFVLPADMKHLDMQCFPSKPLLCFYVVKCEDMQTYKSRIKPQLKKWVDSMNKRRIDYMILYVPLGTRSKWGGSGQKISIMAGNNVYKKIFDRLRVDFGIKKATENGSSVVALHNVGTAGSDHPGGYGVRASAGAGGPSVDNCVHEKVWKLDILEGSSFVGSSYQQQGQSQWSEFIHQLKGCIMEAFESKCWCFEEELRLLDAKRAQTGWEFGALLLAKERVAFMYQQTYLLDDALRHYDELEAIGTNLTYDNAAHYRPDDPIFRFSPLCLNFEQLQMLIVDGQASSAQIELYLFCRQIRILYLKADFTELIKRALVFIEAFHAVLVQEQLEFNILHPYQPYHWAIGACFEIAYTCDIAWNGNGSTISSVAISDCVHQMPMPEQMAHSLGELFYLARRILLRGRRKCVARNGAGDEMLHRIFMKHGDAKGWYFRLCQMFDDDAHDNLETCSWELSHLASLNFSRAGRHRFAVYLGDQCASFHLQHEDYESASRLLRSQERQCLKDKWFSLAYHSRLKICLCELKLGKVVEAVNIFKSLSDCSVQVNQQISDSLFHSVLGSLLAKLEGPLRYLRSQIIKVGISSDFVQPEDTMAAHRDVAICVSFENMCSSAIDLEHLRIYFGRAQHNLESADPRAITFSEYQVILCPKASKIVTLRKAVPAGFYQFDFMRCDVARNTVSLLEASEETEASDFNISSQTHKFRMEIHGPPSISPGSQTLMLLYYRNFHGYQNAIFRIKGSSCSLVNDARLRFMKADCHDPTHPSLSVAEPLNEQHWDDFPSFDIELDQLLSSTSNCVQLLVEAPNAMDVDSVLITASCELQSIKSGLCHTGTFHESINIPVYKSLEEHIEVKHLEAESILAITLTCNRKQDIILKDYRPDFALHHWADRQGDEESIVHDLNTFLRHKFLRSSEDVHFTFIIQKAQLTQARCWRDDLKLHLSYEIMSDESNRWPALATIFLPKDVFMVPYLLHLQVIPQSNALQTHSEQPKYEKYQSFRFTIVITMTSIEKMAHLPLSLLLSLCPTSKDSWMLLGKGCERIMLSTLNQPCVVYRRLLAIRNGYTQYPQFRLYTLEESVVPDKFVHCQNLGMQVCIS